MEKTQKGETVMSGKTNLNSAGGAVSLRDKMKAVFGLVYPETPAESARESEENED